METNNTNYIAPRGNEFKDFIISILKFTNINQKNIDKIVSEENMKHFSNAFTSDAVDKDNNYQTYEQLGDLTANKFIDWYMYRRFPFLRCTKGVKIVARLRINYGAKKSFANIGKKLGLWPFISMSVKDKTSRMNKILEDVFEALIGAIELVIDDTFSCGIGYVLVYDILKNIFDKIDISLCYEDLYDAITRLKETFDCNAHILGKISYETEISEKEKIPGDLYNKVITSKVYQLRNEEKILLATSKKFYNASDAHQYSAKIALAKIEKMGFKKKQDDFYNECVNQAKSLVKK